MGEADRTDHTGKAMPQQRRSIRTRERLLEQGRSAFAELGFERVSLAADILEPAGVSTGSFYHQFTDKADLLVAVLEQIEVNRRHSLMVRLFEIASTPGLDFASGLQAIIGSFVESLNDPTQGWRISLYERDNPDERVQELFRQERPVWEEGLALLLTYWFDAPEAQLEAAAETIAIVAQGLSITVHDLKDAQLEHEYDGLVCRTSAFIEAAVTGLLGPSHASRPPTDPTDQEVTGPLDEPRQGSITA